MKNLSSHDGLHDALTGALTLAAFYEAVAREISRANRDHMELHLLLLNLPLTENDESSTLHKKPVQQEQLLVELVELVHELQFSLRDNDLISRTGLSELSIVFSGNAEDLVKRLLNIVNRFSATVAIVKFQAGWKLPQFLSEGDIALQIAIRGKDLEQPGSHKGGFI